MLVIIYNYTNDARAHESQVCIYITLYSLPVFLSFFCLLSVVLPYVDFVCPVIRLPFRTSLSCTLMHCMTTLRKTCWYRHSPTYAVVTFWKVRHQVGIEYTWCVRKVMTLNAWLDNWQSCSHTSDTSRDIHSYLMISASFNWIALTRVI